MRFCRGQGATEYIVILGVLLIIAVIASVLLGGIPGTGSEEMQNTYDVQLGSGVPFGIKDSVSANGRATISITNKDKTAKTLQYAIIQSPDAKLTQELVPAVKFAAGMQRSVNIDVPCSNSEKKYQIIFVYYEGNVMKRQLVPGTFTVKKCGEGGATPGGECSRDSDCTAGVCDSGRCVISSGYCSSNSQCASGYCDTYTRLCANPPISSGCTPHCALGGAGSVCSETLSGCSQTWLAEHPGCSEIASCNGEYGECSISCGGSCAGSGASCGVGINCCGGLSCTNGVCGGSVLCNGLGAGCDSENLCCNGLVCSNPNGGICTTCRRGYVPEGCGYGDSCCSGYLCGSGFYPNGTANNHDMCFHSVGESCASDWECVFGKCRSGVCARLEMEINSCGAVLDVPNGNYVLAGNLNAAAGQDCITIAADNVTLNCENQVIHGSGSGIGINAYGNSFSGKLVAWCTVENFDTGIIMEGAGSTVSQSIARFNRVGIDGGTGWGSEAARMSITSSQAYNNSQYGIIVGAAYNTVSGNEANYNGITGIYKPSGSSTGVDVQYNSAEGNGQYGFDFGSLTGAGIANNNAHTNGACGMRVRNAWDSVVQYNQLGGNSGCGLDIGSNNGGNIVSSNNLCTGGASSLTCIDTGMAVSSNSAGSISCDPSIMSGNTDCFGSPLPSEGGGK